jgi:sulfoquinovosidase
MQKLVCLLLALGPLGSCSCVPDAFDGELAGLQVNLDNDGATLLVSREGKELLRAPLRQSATRRAEADFEMQFGMFNIEERPLGEWASPDALRLTAVEPLRVAFELRRGEAVFATGEVREAAAGHLTLALDFGDEQNRARVSFGCAPTDHFAGLGAHTHDVDFRGQVVPLWVSEQGIGKTDNNELPNAWFLLGRRHTTHVPVPAMITSRGTAVVLETYAYSVFDLCGSDEQMVTLEAWESTIRLHVIDGPTPLEALARLSDFVGRPRLPPPWILAPWNDAIFGSDNVRAFAHFLRDNLIPSSAIWSEDWRGGNDHGDLYRLEKDWRLDREVYPDYEALAAELKGMGIAPQVYFNTFVGQAADVHDEIVDNGYAVLRTNGEPYVFDGVDANFSPTKLLDLTNPAAVEYVRGHLEEALALGSLGWMADYAEWMPVQRAQLYSGEDPALKHNEYPVLWAKVNDEVMAAFDGDPNGAVAFHRSGHLFSQRYVQVMWAGDQRTSFDDDDGLPTIIPLGVGLAAAGFPIYAHDVAGYQSSTNAPATKELFFRWTELGAFSPVMRTHHGTHARLNWNLQSDEESTEHWRRYASLHIRLYPYLRSLVLDAVFSGRPMWIPLGLAFPDEEELWGVMDQVLLGEALLVAPVVTEGATERRVRLPAGRWAPLLTAGEAVEGPATITVAAPLGEIPVFLRAGGLLPLTANTPMTLLEGVSGVEGLESTEGDRVLYVGLGADGHLSEESGARYELAGSGTDASGLERDEEGAVLVQGNGRVEGPGFALQLSGHPAGRVTRVFFR